MAVLHASKLKISATSFTEKQKAKEKFEGEQSCIAKSKKLVPTKHSSPLV